MKRLTVQEVETEELMLLPSVFDSVEALDPELDIGKIDKYFYLA